MIRLRFVSIDFTPDGAVSHFPGGASWGAQPHDEPHYHALAHRLGYEGDILRYCQEHELAHHVIGEQFNSPSMVLSSLAHGGKPMPPIAAAEESLAMTLQRYARANEVPFIDHIDWPKAKARFLELLGERT